MDYIVCFLSTLLNTEQFMQPHTTFKVRFPSSRENEYADLRSNKVWHRVGWYIWTLIQIESCHRVLFFKTMNYSLISIVNLLVHGLSFTLCHPSLANYWSSIAAFDFLWRTFCGSLPYSCIGMIFLLINKYYFCIIFIPISVVLYIVGHDLIYSAVYIYQTFSYHATYPYKVGQLPLLLWILYYAFLFVDIRVMAHALRKFA
jgi:hypothetical protein